MLARLLRGAAPNVVTVPDVGKSNPATSFSIVDLPEPLSPRMPTTSPSGNSSDRSRSPSVLP